MVNLPRRHSGTWPENLPKVRNLGFKRSAPDSYTVFLDRLEDRDDIHAKV